MQVKAKNGKEAEKGESAHQTTWAGLSTPWNRGVTEQCETPAMEDPTSSSPISSMPSWWGFSPDRSFPPNLLRSIIIITTVEAVVVTVTEGQVFIEPALHARCYPRHWDSAVTSRQGSWSPELISHLRLNEWQLTFNDHFLFPRYYAEYFPRVISINCPTTWWREYPHLIEGKTKLQRCLMTCPKSYQKQNSKSKLITTT